MTKLSFHNSLPIRERRQSYRLAACYRLLRKRIIGKARALELLAERYSEREMTTIRKTVDLWQHENAIFRNGGMLP